VFIVLLEGADRRLLADSVEKLLFLATTISPANAHPIEN